MIREMATRCNRTVDEYRKWTSENNYNNVASVNGAIMYPMETSLKMKKLLRIFKLEKLLKNG